MGGKLVSSAEDSKQAWRGWAWYGLVWYGGIVRCCVVMGMEVWYSMVSSNQADNLLPVTAEWQP